MSNYTPDTEEVRNMYSSPSWVTAAQESERYGEFDDWLDQVKADAFAEGCTAMFDALEKTVDGALILPDDFTSIQNPYRKAADDA